MRRALLPFVLLAAAAAQQTATVRIDASKAENRIDPRLYGQFVEFMFEGVKGGLHAELIRNRSFEEPANAIGLSRYWEREPDDRNDDFGMAMKWDDSTAYPERPSAKPAERGHSMKFELRGAWQEPRHGINQPRIPIRGGVEYIAYVWLKPEQFDGKVTLALEQDRSGGERYAVAEIEGISGGWKKYEVRLRPAKSDPLAKFVILFTGKGTIWLDQVSLLPADAGPGGTRPDVYPLIAALKPPFIRWPGGNVAQDYHWQWGVGPRDARTTWSNLSWWNEPEPSDFGTDEFLAFCRALRSEPHIVVNVEGRGATVADAVAWVEYLNGPATSRHGAQRAANGHAEPYGVSVIEVGNEIWGHWVRGHSNAATYAANYNRYHAAMTKADPKLQFIAVGDNDMKWNETVLRTSGRNMDYLAIHHYYGTGEMQDDPLNLMARPLFYERFYQRVRQLIREAAPGRDIKLIINEWNTGLPIPRQHSMESALYAARLMNVFERSGDIVVMSAVSDLVNGWPGGIIQASRHGVFVTPTYHVNKLYNDHLGTTRLATQVASPTFNSSKEGKNIPYLDVVVSRSIDGRKIFIKAVNTDQQRPLATSIEVSGARVADSATWHLLTAPTLHTSNSFSDPEAVKPASRPLSAGSRFTVELPKHSVSVIVLEVQP